MGVVTANHTWQPRATCRVDPEESKCTGTRENEVGKDKDSSGKAWAKTDLTKGGET